MQIAIGSSDKSLSLNEVRLLGLIEPLIGTKEEGPWAITATLDDFPCTHGRIFATTRFETLPGLTTEHLESSIYKMGGRQALMGCSIYYEEVDEGDTRRVIEFNGESALMAQVLEAIPMAMAASLGEAATLPAVVLERAS